MLTVITVIYVVGFSLSFYLHSRNGFDAFRRNQIIVCYRKGSSEAHFNLLLNKMREETTTFHCVTWAVLAGLLWPVGLHSALYVKTLCRNSQLEAYTRWSKNNGN